VDFWEDFTFDGGVRWNIDAKQIDYQLDWANQIFEVDQANTWQAPTGGVRLTYRFRDDTEAFWKYTRGWKGGHYNATSSNVQQVSVADPEVNNAFEIGTRGAYFDGLLSFNTQFFYYAYENYQIFTAQQFLNGSPEFVVINANDAESYGVEADIVGEPWEGARASINFAWLETQFLDFVQEQQTSFPTAEGESLVITREIQNSGNPLLNSPKFTLVFGLQQILEMGRFGSITPRYDGVWKDDTFFDATAGRGIPNLQGLQYLPENTIGQQAYWLHNLRLTYRTPGENIELALWVRNLTNQAYKTFAFDGSTFNNITIYFVGEPRTFGGSLRVSF
jgi:iron complex outermembrane receptor protein